MNLVLKSVLSLLLPFISKIAKALPVLSRTARYSRERLCYL